MQTILLVCLIVFSVLLILLERIQFIKILIRLLLSLLTMYAYVKAIADGKSIILYSILVTICLTVINTFIKNGIHKKSFSELVSILITSGITSLIIYLICKNTSLQIYKEEIKSFNGLKKSENAMFGVFMISTLGIFMDIISRIIFRLDAQKDKTVDTPWKEQFIQGIEHGKKYVSEKINMIVLILLSVSLFPICVDINKGMNFYDICNQDKIFAYVLIAIVANIGLVLSVLVTASIYACFNRKKTIYKTVSENKIDGKRSLKI